MTVFQQDLPIAIGADHAGFAYKEMIKNQLDTLGWKVVDKGSYDDSRVDYPDFAHPVAEMVENRLAAAGILICGSGNGVCITANKHPGIRAALAWTTELASLARQHNNANVLCLPARFVTEEAAQEMVGIFLESAFEGGRHQNRVDKISQ